MPNWMDEVLDQGLDYLDSDGIRLDICSSQPTTYAEATSTYSRGNKTGLSIPAPQDRSGGGREVVVPAISDGAVTDTGTVDYWAITDGSSVLICTGTLSAQQTVTDGNTFTLTSFTIGIPDPS
jgi:hypothetical protein